MIGEPQQNLQIQTEIVVHCVQNVGLDELDRRKPLQLPRNKLSQSRKTRVFQHLTIVDAGT